MTNRHLSCLDLREFPPECESSASTWFFLKEIREKTTVFGCHLVRLRWLRKIGLVPILVPSILVTNWTLAGVGAWKERHLTSNFTLGDTTKVHLWLESRVAFLIELHFFTQMKQCKAGVGRRDDMVN